MESQICWVGTNLNLTVKYHDRKKLYCNQEVLMHYQGSQFKVILQISIANEKNGNYLTAHKPVRAKVGADKSRLIRTYALPEYQCFIAGNVALGNGKAQTGRTVLRKLSNCSLVAVELFLYCLFCLAFF